MTSLPAPATEAAARPARLGVPPLQRRDGDLVVTSPRTGAVIGRPRSVTRAEAAAVIAKPVILDVA